MLNRRTLLGGLAAIASGVWCQAKTLAAQRHDGDGSTISPGQPTCRTAWVSSGRKLDFERFHREFSMASYQGHRVVNAISVSDRKGRTEWYICLSDDTAENPYDEMPARFAGLLCEEAKRRQEPAA
jgi:hypothetical protein